MSADLDLEIESLGQPAVRIPWETFARIVDRFAHELGDAEAIRRFSEEQLATDALGIFRVVARVISRPRDLYFLGARWMGPSLFPMINAEMWEGTDGLLMQRLTLQPGHRDCPALFHIIHGALAVLPRTWGHAASEVTLEIGSGSATYSIRPKTLRRGPLYGLIRAVQTRIAFRTMLRELEDQQRAINASYSNLRDAHARISAQARDLARVDSIGRELSRDVDLDRVLDVLIRILREDLAFRGVAIWLAEIRGAPGEITIATNEPLRCVRADGTTEGASTTRYLLESAGRRLGELVVYGTESDLEDSTGSISEPSVDPARTGATRVLSLLLPWIALALDNALTYARLERHAEVLEERVQERTGRLLAANHHLVREIDERKRATDALLQSEAQLRASERLASIGTLAAGIAHEINNPVGSILAAAQLAQILRDDPSASSDIDAALGDIVNEAKRCGDIVRGVLQFAREERTDKWDCDLRDLVIRSVRLTTAFADKHGARLRTELPEPSPRVVANPTQMEQAIVNLIRNAIESGGSEVAVRVVSRAADRLVTIEVHDDGIGISEADRLRILEPFYTTRRATGGTGLGLSVVHGIALEHGGDLTIESRAGQG
ncbi:MAG: HAMP domain-containing histidine kinase [Deltaproteobacteria bacterium]|nr:HAMP domain-containing histidine kinase [Deltaproteobacteria bacterium]